MAKRIFPIAVVALLAMVCLTALVGCDILGGLGGDSLTGIYVRDVNSSIDYLDYYTLNSSKNTWSYSDGGSGTFEISGSNITFYKDSQKYFTATISGEKNHNHFSFTLDGISYTYVFEQGNIEEYHPTSYSYNIYFEVDSGAKLPNDQKRMQITRGNTYNLPTPERKGYVFLGWKESATGMVYTSQTPMPSRNVYVQPIWQEVSQKQGQYVDGRVTIDYSACGNAITDVSSQEKSLRDEYVATPQGKGFWRPFSACFSITLKSSDIGGADKVGTENNFNLLTDVQGLQISANSGYQCSVYKGAVPNQSGQDLNYGKNYVVLTVYNDSGSECYLFNVYLKQDYVVTIYDGHSQLSGTPRTVTVAEGDVLPSNMIKQVQGLTFDCFKNVQTDEAFDIAQPINQNVSLYQTYNKIEITLDAGEGSGSEEFVLVEPYRIGTYQNVVPQRTGYYFLGWQDDQQQYYIGTDGKTVQPVEENNICTSLSAAWQKQLFAKYALQPEIPRYYLTAEEMAKYDITLDSCSVNPLDCRVTYENGQPQVTYVNGSTPVDLTYIETVQYGQETSFVSQSGGFSFLGWYDRWDPFTRLDQGPNYSDYTFVVTQEIWLLAKWTYFTVTLSQNVSGVGEVAISGNNAPKRGNFTPTIAEDAYTVQQGTMATVTATTYIGYEFAGWYDGETKVSIDNQLSYQFQMGAENKQLQARYQVSAELAPYKFTSTKTECILIGMEDKTLTTLEISAIFTGCRSGALAGMNNLQTLTVSYIGADSQQTKNLGFLFGASSYSDNGKIPQSLTKVVYTGPLAEGIFRNCTTLIEIQLSQDLTQIPQYAFAGCTALTTISLPNSVTQIGLRAFDNCTSLSQLTLPQNLVEIGENAFNGTISLAAISLPGGYTQIGNSALAGMSITELALPDNTTSIGDYAFANCAKLTALTIPQSVQTIGSFAFSGCDLLTTLQLPSSITNISEGLFGGYTGLTQFTVGDEVTIIGNAAFSGCVNLQSVTVGKNVTTIGNQAFLGCSQLSSITFQKESGRCKVTSYGDGAFAGTAITVFAFPDSQGLATIGKNLFQNGALQEVTVGNNIPIISEEAFRGLTTLTKVTLNAVQEIGDNAFYGCTNLHTVTLSSSAYMQKLGDYAFYGCHALSYLPLGNSLVYIGKGCFQNTVYNKPSVPVSVITIMPYAFPSTVETITFGMKSDGSQWCYAYKSYNAQTGIELETWRPNSTVLGADSLVTNANTYRSKYISTKLIRQDS